MIGLLVRPRPATPATITPRGKTTRAATIPFVHVMAVPRAAWTCTDPAQLEQAARDLTDAARWLRDQQRPAPAVDSTAPTLFDHAEANSTP